MTDETIQCFREIAEQADARRVLRSCALQVRDLPESRRLEEIKLLLHKACLGEMTAYFDRLVANVASLAESIIEEGKVK